MVKKSQYIAYFLNLILVLFLVAVCTALFSLEGKVQMFNLPALVRVLLEIIFYAAVLFLFYSNRTIEPDLWLRAVLMFVVFRVGIALLNAIAFTIAGPEGTTFSAGFRAALFGNPTIHLIEFLAVPFFAFPFIFEYAKSQAGKEIEELAEYEESESEFAERIPPGQIESQIVPIRLWRQFFLTENADELRELLSGVRLSSYTKTLVMPAPEETEEVPEIAKLLDDLLPQEVGESAGEQAPPQPTPTPQASSQPPPAAETPVSTPAAQTAPPQVEETAPSAAGELSELEQLISIAETSEPAEQPAPETPAPSPPPESAPPQEAPPQVQQEAVEIPEEISVEEIPIGESAPAEETPALDLTQEISEIPLELPESIAEEAPAPQQTAPPQPEQPQPAAAPQQGPPPGGYTITSPDDFFQISLRRLIELNQGKQGAQVLERLIKRGADFQLSIPMTMLIPQLREGKAAVTVEYVYSEIPIELVNFMSTDQSGDLSELELDLPLDEIMSQTDPKIIFGDQTPQEESRWSKATDEVNIDEVFDNLGGQGGQSTPGEENPQPEDIVDLTGVEELNVAPEVEEVTESSGFPKPLMDFASQNGLAPIMEPSEKIGVVMLCPVGTPTTGFIPAVEWLATTKLSDKWAQTPCYAFVETEMSSTGILINPGAKTRRDAFVVVTNPKDMPEMKSLLDEGYQTLEVSEQAAEIPLEEIDPIPVMSERDIKTDKGYSGMWVKLPGKTVAVVSAISADEDNMSKIVTIGTHLTELISGAGKMFSTWQRIVLYASGWAVAMHPIQGGIMLIELSEGLQFMEVLKEFQEISQHLMDIPK
ncbi:hypothetical protein J7K99_03025 [bacterium]|nr:hypothetical protein [bacterium]